MHANTETDRVNDAIARSISHNEITKVPYSTDAYQALRAAAEGWVDTRDHRGVQFWGSDEGDEWRVHLATAEEIADPDAQCPTHGCSKWRCTEAH